MNEGIVSRIGLAFVDHFRMHRLVIGRDTRLSSEPLAEALVQTLTSQGIDVVDIGLCGTEEMYFAVFHGEAAGVDGGIMITASHNPADYNGMKFVRQGARPVSGDSGLEAVKTLAESPSWFAEKMARPAQRLGEVLLQTDKGAYIEHLLASIRTAELQPLKIVVNAGNGCAGPVIDLLEPHLPLTFIRLQHEPDGTFPHGVPNPLLVENREATARMVCEQQADLGIAWDGDFDRCFFFDASGRFIEGYYLVGLLAVTLLQDHPGATILHDPRLVWNTRELVEQAGGVAVMTRTGHAFIKEKMRETGALYGGEMSAHHYFRDFGSCDSGMIPWLLVCQLMARRKQPLAAMVDDRMRAYPVSGEINTRVQDPEAVLREVETRYRDGEKDYTDGISISYPKYRFNIRQSNTEPLLRLNVETRGDQRLLKAKTRELLDLIQKYA